MHKMDSEQPKTLLVAINLNSGAADCIFFWRGSDQSKVVVDGSLSVSLDKRGDLLAKRLSRHFRGKVLHCRSQLYHS